MNTVKKLFIGAATLCILVINTGFAQQTELPDAAIDNALPHIPEHALLNAPPFKTITIETDSMIARFRPHYVSLDDPANHETPVGTPMDGVAKLILTRTDFTVGCTGTLLTTSTGAYVLTAAHCVSDDFGGNIFVSGTATFTGATTSESIPISSADIHPDWDGSIVRGNDLAVLTLSHRPDPEINSYDIDRNANSDIGSISEKVGYGLSGIQQNDPANYGFGTKRNGMNRYDDVADTMLKALGLRAGRDFVRNSVLQYDFDNGASEHDAFGFFFGNHDTGLGNDEVASASGDSGGPTIKDGLIQGITSYGISLSFTDGSTSDITPDAIDSSVGEFAGDTHVALYASWIDSVTGGNASSSNDPEPVKCNRRQQMLGNC